ncbi:MAG TPA: uracil-DNA glycosylase family protein [Acidimicrobiia bacterium]|nr:uracil-DNA glycosylase family protein [Acidimicrobiia bacterium]
MERGTVAVYEQRAREWRARRPARFEDRARALAAAVPHGALRADLGCGPGLHLPLLGRPVLALDAAEAMLRLAREAAPDAWCVRADLEHLPLRAGALRGAWARASLLHVPAVRLPDTLRELHLATSVGAPIALTMLAGDGDGLLDDDDFPGRFFSCWQPDRLADVLVGAGFDVEECALVTDGEWIAVRMTRARTLADTVGSGMRLLVCGLNPSIYAADRGVGFARPGNRFWPAALAAGILSRDRDPAHALAHHGIGMTDLVKRATTGAGELTVGEYRAGAARVRRLVEWLQPRAVCFVGLAGWRAAVDRRAVAGVRPDGFGGRPAYVMPNSSGLNAHATPAILAEHLRAAAALADSA